MHKYIYVYIKYVMLAHIYKCKCVNCRSYICGHYKCRSHAYCGQTFTTHLMNHPIYYYYRRPILFTMINVDLNSITIMHAAVHQSIHIAHFRKISDVKRPLSW